MQYAANYDITKQLWPEELTRHKSKHIWCFGILTQSRRLTRTFDLMMRICKKVITQITVKQRWNNETKNNNPGDDNVQQTLWRENPRFDADFSSFLRIATPISFFFLLREFIFALVAAGRVPRVNGKQSRPSMLRKWEPCANRFL